MARGLTTGRPVSNAEGQAESAMGARAVRSFATATTPMISRLICWLFGHPPEYRSHIPGYEDCGMCGKRWELETLEPML
jgi:hypothetical protein